MSELSRPIRPSVAAPAARRALDAGRERRLPRGIGLLVAMAVSIGLWIGLGLIVVQFLR